MVGQNCWRTTEFPPSAPIRRSPVSRPHQGPRLVVVSVAKRRPQGRIVTRVELSFVIEGRKGETGRADFGLLLRDGGFDIVRVTPQQAKSPLMRSAASEGAGIGQD